MVEDKNISKTYNNLVDEILKKKNPGEILEELSRPHQPTGSLQGKPGKSAPGAPVPRKTFKDSFPWSYVKDSYLLSGKALLALVYFIIAMVLVNSETIKGFIFYDLGIRLYLSSVFFHWITDFSGLLATEAAIFTIWPLLLSFLSALLKDKKNAKLKYRIYDILYIVVVISILSLAVLFVNVDRNKKACYLETYNYYCIKHHVANLEIPGIKIDVTKACKTGAGNDACDFIGVYENNEYRLKLKMCRETIDAGLLSTDFVSVNTGLFESLLEAKWAKFNESNVNERLRKFKDQVNRYQSFILDISGDQEFKKFLNQLAPDPAALDILVLFYYLDNKWSQPGLVLKARMLQIVKNKFLIENNVGPTVPSTGKYNNPPQKEVAQVHKPPVPEAKTEKDNPVTNNNPYEIGLYYPLAGTFEVSGKISDGEWKWNNTENCWTSTIRDFSVTAKWPVKTNPTAFIKLGFVKNEKGQRYEVIIDYNTRKVSACALDINLYGFSENNRPDDFQFHQKQKIMPGKPQFVSFTINDISIRNAKPKEIQFDIPSKGDINPVINVYFDTPSPPASSHPMSILGLGSTLAIELKNDKGILIKYLKWESPFNAIDLSADKYATIELITPFGRCRCQKPVNNQLTLSAFVKPVKVNVNEGDAEICLIYSINSGTSWNTFQIVQSDQTLKSVIIYLPVLIPNESTTWRLIARKEGFKDCELKLGYLSADESGINDVIKLEKSDKPRLTGIDILCKEKYERIGGKFDKLGLQFFDKSDRLIFQGFLNAIEFVPGDAHHFNLNDSENKFYFSAEIIDPSIDKLKVDFNDFWEKKNVSIKLKSENPAMPIPDKVYSNVHFLDSKSKNFIPFQIDPEKTFKGNVLFSYNIDERNAISPNTKTLKICCPGYRGKTIDLVPGELSSSSSLVEDVSMQLLPPEVVVIISGNISSNRGEYYSWSRDAIADIWDDFSQRMQVGVANDGKFEIMKKKEKLQQYGPSPGATNFYVNDEIKKAKEYFKGTIDGCGNPPPQRLVYISREPGRIDQNNTGTTPIYIISSEKKPTGWQGVWFMASSEDSIKDALRKILEGN